LNGLDLYYQVEMPEVFFLDHAVGRVLGNGKYGNYFAFLQNCTVGNKKVIYRSLGNMWA
jgi:serine O-acetyltransferase